MKKPKTSSDDDFSFDFGGADEFFPLDNPSSNSSDKKNKPKGAKGYFKNVVKSVGRLGVKVAKDLYPEAFDLKDQFLAKDDNDPHFDIKGTIKNARNEIHKYGNVAFDTARTLKKNAKKALLTGEFGGDSMDEMLNETFGDLMGDSSDFDFSGFDSSDGGGDYNSNESDTPDASGKKRSHISAQAVTAKSAMASAKVSAQLSQNQISATYGAAQAQLQHQNILFSQQMDIFQEQHRQKMAVMKNIASNLVKVVNQNNISNRAQMEFSAKSLAFSQDMSALLKEIRNSQWTLTKAAKKEDEFADSEYHKEINGGGMNLRKLGGRLFKSATSFDALDQLKDVKNMVDSLFDMGDMMGTPGQMLSGMLGDTIRQGLLNKIISGKSRTHINDVNTMLSALPGALNRKLGTLGESNTIDDIYEKLSDSVIKKLPFGNKLDNWLRDKDIVSGVKSRFKMAQLTDNVRESSGRYAMGNPDQVHPFDNKAHYVLTEVIPKQLSRIDAGVNHTEETYFDFKDNTFKTVSSMAKNKEKMRSETLNSLSGAYEYKNALREAGANIKDPNIRKILDSDKNIEEHMHRFFGQNRDAGLIRDNLAKTNDNDGYGSTAFNEIRKLLHNVDGFDESKLKNEDGSENTEAVKMYAKLFTDMFNSLENTKESGDSWSRNKLVKLSQGQGQYANELSKKNYEFEDRYAKLGSSIAYDSFAKVDQARKDLKRKKAELAMVKEKIKKTNVVSILDKLKEQEKTLNDDIRNLEIFINENGSEELGVNIRSSYMGLNNSKITDLSKITSDDENAEKTDKIKSSLDNYAIKDLEDDSTHGIVQNIYNLLLEGIDVYTHAGSDNEHSERIQERKNHRSNSFIKKVEKEQKVKVDDYCEFNLTNFIKLDEYGNVTEIQNIKENEDAYAYVNGIKLYIRNGEKFEEPEEEIKREKEQDKDGTIKPKINIVLLKSLFGSRLDNCYVLKSQYNAYYSRYFTQRRKDAANHDDKDTFLGSIKSKIKNIPIVGNTLSKLADNKFDGALGNFSRIISGFLGKTFFGSREGYDVKDVAEMVQGKGYDAITEKRGKDYRKNHSELVDVNSKDEIINAVKLEIDQNKDHPENLLNVMIPEIKEETKKDKDGNEIKTYSPGKTHLLKDILKEMAPDGNIDTSVRQKIEDKYHIRIPVPTLRACANQIQAEKDEKENKRNEAVSSFEKEYEEKGIKGALGWISGKGKEVYDNNVKEYVDDAKTKVQNFKIGGKTIKEYMNDLNPEDKKELEKRLELLDKEDPNYEYNKEETIRLYREELKEKYTEKAKEFKNKLGESKLGQATKKVMNQIGEKEITGKDGQKHKIKDLIKGIPDKVSNLMIGDKTLGERIADVNDYYLIELLKDCKNPKEAADILSSYAVDHAKSLSQDTQLAFMLAKEEIQEKGTKSFIKDKFSSIKNKSKTVNKAVELKKDIENQVIKSIPMEDGKTVGDHIAAIGDKSLIEKINQANNIKETTAILREYGTEEAQNIANAIETYSKEHPLQLGKMAVGAGIAGVVGLASSLLGKKDEEANDADLKDTTTAETGDNVANTKEELEAKKKEEDEVNDRKGLLGFIKDIRDKVFHIDKSSESMQKDMKDGIKIDDKSLDGINSAVSGVASDGLGGLFNSLDQMTGGALSKTGVGKAVGGFLNSDLGKAASNVVGSKLGIPGAKSGGGGLVSSIAGKKAMDLIGKFIGKGAAKGAGSAAGAAAKVAAEGAEAVGKNSGLIGKILTNVTKSLDDFLKSPKIAKVLGSSGIKNIKNGLLGGIKKFSTKPSFLTKLAKNFTKALPFISIGLAVTDFFKGMGLVSKYFDLGKGIKPPAELRICSGLAEALSGLLFGIPGIIASFMGKSSFAELLFDWFGSKEMKSSMNRYHQYNEKRAKIFGIDDPQALVAFEDRNKKGFSGAIQAIGRGVRAAGHVLGKLGSGGSLVDSNEEKDCKTLKFKAVEIFKKWKTEKYDMLDQLYEKMANDSKYGGKNLVEDMNATNIINADSLMEYNEDGSLVEDNEYNQQICDRIDKQNLFRKEYLTACIQAIKDAGLAWLTNKCSIQLFAKMTDKNAADIKGLDNRTLGQKLMAETKFVVNGYQTEEQVKAKQEKFKEWDKQQKEERKKIGQERDLKKQQLKDEKAAKKAAKQMNAKGRKGREATYNFYDYTDQTKEIMENASAMTQSVYSQYIAADKDISTSGVTGTAPMGEPTDRGGEPTKENYIFNMGKEKLKKAVAPLGSPMDYATKRMKESMAKFSEQFTKNFTTDFSDKLVEKLQVLDAINAEQKRHNEATEKFFAACLGMMGQIAKQSGNVKIASKIDQMVSMVTE